MAIYPLTVLHYKLFSTSNYNMEGFSYERQQTKEFVGI